MDARVMCGRPRLCKDNFGGIGDWSGAVMCPACWMRHMPLALMKFADRVPIKVQRSIGALTRAG